MDFHPLDDEICKNLSFNCCWVLEAKVMRAELDVPLSDSSGGTLIVEDI